MKTSESSASASASGKSSSTGDKPLYSLDVDVTRGKNQVYVAHIPSDLYDDWLKADSGKNLGSMEIISQPTTEGVPAATAAAAVDSDGMVDEEQSTKKKGKILVYDKSHKLYTYDCDLIAVPQENVSIIMSENHGSVRFALEGTVDSRIFVRPNFQRKQEAKEKKKKKEKKDDLEGVIMDEPPDSDRTGTDYLNCPVPIEDESERTVKAERRTRGDKELVKNEMFKLMEKKPLWGKHDLADRLQQPVSFIDELLTEWCEKVEVDSDSGFKRPRVMYRLKGYLRLSADTDNSSTYQPPSKRPAP